MGGTTLHRAPTRRGALALIAAGAGAAFARPGAALAQGGGGQPWPAGPVKIVSPYTPGGANDTLARFCAQHLGAALGQAFVVENRPGAGGNLGAELVARAAPDGHTLLMAAGAAAINHSLYRDLPFDILKDFAPVTLVATVPNVLAVNPRSPVRSAAEFLAWAKAKPGGVSYGSAGIGTVPHLAMEMFLRAAGGSAGVRGVHVPYRGSAPAVTALLAGEVDALFENLPPLAGQLRSGALRGLCISSAERHPDFPDLPTAAEAAGLPGFEVTAWQSILAPAGTPAAIRNTVAAEVGRALASPEGRARVAQLGALPRGTAPEEFGAFLAAEVRRWAEVVQATGARLE
jgi:tripartite-type tricarboxylate transporter receptor subunit TctC